MLLTIFCRFLSDYLVHQPTFESVHEKMDLTSSFAEDLFPKVAFHDFQTKLKDFLIISSGLKGYPNKDFSYFSTKTYIVGTH